MSPGAPNHSAPARDKKVGIRQRLHEALARIRKNPVVTPEQRLQVKIDSLNAQARQLDGEYKQLKAGTSSFAARAESTPLPTATPPSKHDPLFEKHPKAPANQYDTQLKEHVLLVGEWKAFEKDVKAFGRRLDHFEDTVEHTKKSNVDLKKPVDEAGHAFIGLDNALVRLKEQRLDLNQAVAAIPLPREK